MVEYRPALAGSRGAEAAFMLSGATPDRSTNDGVFAAAEPASSMSSRHETEPASVVADLSDRQPQAAPKS